MRVAGLLLAAALLAGCSSDGPGVPRAAPLVVTAGADASSSFVVAFHPEGAGFGLALAGIPGGTLTIGELARWHVADGASHTVALHLEGLTGLRLDVFQGKTRVASVAEDGEFVAQPGGDYRVAAILALPEGATASMGALTVAVG